MAAPKAENKKKQASAAQETATKSNESTNVSVDGAQLSATGDKTGIYIMKKVIVMGIISALLNFFGCSSSPETAPANKSDNTTTEANIDDSTKPADSATNDNSSKTDEAAGVAYDLNAETQFYYKFQNTENAAEYERAAKVIKDANGVTGDMSSSSKRFAGWFMIEFEAAKSDIEALDGPAPKKPSYLVDIANNKVVATNAFEDAKPLIDRVLAVYDSIDSNRKKSGLLDGLCGIVSTIAHGDMNFIGAGNGSNEPELKKENDATIIVFYRNIGSSYVDIERMTFTYHNDGKMTFEKSNLQD